MSKYAVIIFESLDSKLHENWNELVMEAHEGTFFHSFEWCRILEQYGQASNSFKSYHVIAEDKCEHKLVGVMPLFLDRKGAILSPPYGDYGGPCLSRLLSESEKKILIKEMMLKVEQNFRRKVKRILLKSVSENYLGYFSNLGYETRPAYSTFLLSLVGKNTEGIWMGFRRDVRRGVKKAGRSGVISEEISEKKFLEDYYEIYRATMGKLGASVRSFYFFEVLWDVLYPKKNLYILLAKHKQKYIAGIISISWKKVIHIFGNVSLFQSLKLHPNDLIYYETIKWAVKTGHKTVDFGLSPLKKESGLYQFKERWGGTKKLLHTVTKTYQKSLFSRLKQFALRTLSGRNRS